jgi:hypothetical protein
MLRTRAAVLAFALALTLTTSARAQGFGSPTPGPDLSNPTIQRVMGLLVDPAHVKAALAFVHFGNENRGASVVQVTNVRDAGSGAILPGFFCCTVRYRWGFLGKTGWSDVNYFYTGSGQYYGHSTGATSAALLKQFAEAEVSRWALKNLVLPLVNNQQFQNNIGWLIDNVSVRGAFDAYMKLQFS